MTMPMSVISTHDVIYSSLLSSRYDLQRLYDQDISLAEDPDFYRILMSDGKFSATVRQLYNEICASGWIMHPGSRTAASAQKSRIVSWILKKSNLSAALLSMCKAIIMARSYAYPEGRGVVAAIDNTPPQDWWVPVNIKDIDKQRIVLYPRKVWVNESGEVAEPDGKAKREPEGHYEIRVKRKMSDPAEGGVYKPMSREYQAALIELVYGDEEERLGMGRALAEAGYMLLRGKAIIMKSGLKGVNRWAEELLVGTVDPDRPASKNKKNVNLAQDLLTKLNSMREGNVIVVPEGLADVKSIATTGTGHEICMSMLNYIDDSWRECCLGVQPKTGQEGMRSGAGMKIGQQNTNKNIQMHRTLLAACVNRTLIATILRLNRQQFEDAGCGDGEDPIFSLVDDAHNDPEKMTERIEKAQAMKMQIPLEWAHDAMEIPMPSEGEPILEAPDPPAPSIGPDGKPVDPSNPGDPNDPDNPDAPESGNKFDSKKDSKEQADHKDGEAEQKSGERANPKSAAYSAQLELMQTSVDDRISRIEASYQAHLSRLESIIERMVTENYSSRSMSPSPTHMTINVPAQSPAPITFEVPAPIVNISVPEREVNIDARSTVSVPERSVTIDSPVSVTVPERSVTVNSPVTVQPSPAASVTIPSADKRIDITRDENGKITGADIKPQ